jgi:phage-related protein
MKDEIAIWTAGQIAGTATITAEFHVSTAVATMGLLVPACDVTTK